jgi:GAF domain-containing protein
LAEVISGQSPTPLNADRTTSGAADAHADALLRLRGLVTERRRNQRDDDASLDSALAVVCDALQSPLGRVLELTGSGDVLAIRVGLGWNEGIADSVVVTAATTSTAGYALTQRGAVMFDDVQGTKRFTDAALLRSHRVTATLAVRIETASGVRGVLSVHERTSRRYTTSEATFIEAAALIIGALM